MMEARVPWDDPLRFCESVDAAVASIGNMFSDDWRSATRRVYIWAKDAGSDPFAVTVRLILDRGMPAETARAVFQSLCDHRQSLFTQKSAAIIGWAEATASLGPTGNPDADIALWVGAWATAGEASPDTDIHSACLPSILQALREETGIRVCDEFLQRLADPSDTERAIFAISVLKDALIVAEGLHSTYKGLFGGVLDILYWPAMAGCAATRIRASLLSAQTHIGAGICEHKTSSAIPQVVSLTQEVPHVSSV